MAKQTWDKAIHAAPTINHKLTQDDWHKLDHTVPAAPGTTEATDPEPRVYNPSGPFYKTPSPLMTAPPDPPAPPSGQSTPFSNKETR